MHIRFPRAGGARRPTACHRNRLRAGVIAMLLAAPSSLTAAQPLPAGLAAAPAPESPPGFPHRPQAPAGAPNVLIVMTDDVGYGASSTFGGAIPTPNLDAVAANGLRYGNFHTTALCSPSRAALLTGRNHQAVGFGHVPDLATGEPGYTSVLPRSAATFAQVLGRNGYDSAFFGKNHNVPSWEAGPLGPFTQWGNGLGFGYFYGFHGGMTDQFRPSLIENTRAVPTPDRPGYFLDRDLVDHALSWLDVQRTTDAGRPFLLYLAPGTAHAPVQAPDEWLRKFRGKFDGGWDRYREETFARQQRLGLIPASAVLPPRPPGVPAWSSLSAEQRRVYARYMEAYGAALACFDDQFGRLIAALKRSGQYDNTLILFIEGDNGATPEGGANGAVNYLGRTNPDAELAWAASHLDAIGGPDSYPVAPVGWAVALNTPWPYYKVVASRLGGITNGLVVSWPDRIRQRGVRTQFAHITDIAPTLYDVIGITPPAEVDGVQQMPLEGSSLASTFARADAPASHTRQYFELDGNAAIFDNGWLLATRMADSRQQGNTTPDTAAPWQLYDLAPDPTQTSDVAARFPAKAAELRALFDAEALRNKVYPQVLGLGRLFSYNRPEYGNAPGRYVFTQGPWSFSEGTFPTLLNRDWTITADVEVSPASPSGMLVTQGGRFQGWGLLIRNGKPQFVYKLGDMPVLVSRLESPAALGPGKHTIVVRAVRDRSGPGATLSLAVDGAQAASVAVSNMLAFKFGNEPAEIGRDSGTMLDGDPAPFAWPGAVTITMDLGPIVSPGSSPVH